MRPNMKKFFPIKTNTIPWLRKLIPQKNLRKYTVWNMATKRETGAWLPVF
jgi:hypothetical protein